jgi:DNA-binding beta-propeller fold protein YncE
VISAIMGSTGSMQFSQAIVFAILLVAARTSGSAPIDALRPGADERETSRHLSFVREFSSSQDVKPGHPVLNRTLDIVAGPKDGEPATGVLLEPYGVTTDSSHRVFVTDSKAGAVHVFDFLHAKYSILRGGDHPLSPAGIAADRQGNVYVSDSSLQTVLVYDSKGKFVRYLKKLKGHESFFDAPQGLAVDAATGHIYVCDTDRHMVIMLDRKGHVLAQLGKRGGGVGPGEFRFPTQVVAAGDEIAVLDSQNARIQILDARGNFRKEIMLGEVPKHAGLAMDKDRNIYLSDPFLSRLRVFDHDGKLLYEFGEQGIKAGQFNGISGIWVESGHCLFAVDTQNKRVQVFQVNASRSTGECP